MAYEAVIGLECHIQLNTRSKMFCDCPAAFGDEPNSNVCPVCLGLPGALPRANRAAVEAALRLGLALGCDIRRESVFARKNYFYPDMPKNYQITQYDRPLCEGGALPVALDGAERRFELIRVHAEEDTGKSFHPERYGDRPVSRVDFNRAGVPLLELVTKPVFRDPAECAAFLAGLRRLVRWLGISDGDMEKGHLRCDANVSIRPAGESGFGTKTELKNLNSIRGVEKGLAAEIARQRQVLDAGGTIEQSTLLYDAEHDRLAVMRSKEHAHDYRYFPEPDLPVLSVSEAWIREAGARLPELPWAWERRMIEHYGIPAYDAAVLGEQRDVADYYEALVSAGAPPKKASNWLMTEVLRHLKERSWTMAEWRQRLPAAKLSWLIGQVESVRVTAAAAKGVIEAVAESGGDPETIVVERGKTATLGFLVGQVMKRSGGRAVPQAVRSLLEAELAKRALPG